MAHGAAELDRALELTNQALELGRTLRSADLEAEALQAGGRILIDQGEMDEGLGHLDEAMLFAVEGRLRPYSTGKVYCSMIAACEEVGDFDRAAEWTEATLRWAEDNHPFAIFPGICRVHRAVVLKRRGALVEAEAEAARACEELSQSHLANSAAAYAEVGDIRRRLGDLAEAEAAFARSQEISRGPCGGLALLRLAQGRVDDAMSTISDCVEGAANPLARAGIAADARPRCDRRWRPRGGARRGGRARRHRGHLRHPEPARHRAVDPRPIAARAGGPGRRRGAPAGRWTTGVRSMCRTRRPPRGPCWARRCGTTETKPPPRSRSRPRRRCSTRSAPGSTPGSSTTTASPRFQPVSPSGRSRSSASSPLD